MKFVCVKGLAGIMTAILIDAQVELLTKLLFNLEDFIISKE